MSVWALIINGVVFETTTTNPVGIFPPDMDWVPCPAGTVQGDTYNDTTFAAPAAPPAPTLARQAEALIGGGITITSTGTPSLNGVYAANPAAQGNLLAVQTYILTNAKFPGSSGTYPWLDASGAAHIFPSVAEFEAFATAVANFVADCTMIILTGTGTLPVATATIP